MADDLPHETFDASDPAAENNARRDAIRRAREDIEVLYSVLNTKNGRAFVYGVLSVCKIYDAVFEPGAPDVTAYRLGERNIGALLLDKCMEASTDLYVLMVKEGKAEEARQAQLRENEEKNRQDREGPIDVAGLIADLPPPAGYPGGPPLLKKKDN